MGTEEAVKDGGGCCCAGINSARKGRLTREHVFSTRSLAEVKDWFAAKR